MDSFMHFLVQELSLERKPNGHLTFRCPESGVVGIRIMSGFQSAHLLAEGLS